jgi:hypothetical protein
VYAKEAINETTTALPWTLVDHDSKIIGYIRRVVSVRVDGKNSVWFSTFHLYFRDHYAESRL